MREVVTNLPDLTGGGAGITIPTVGPRRPRRTSATTASTFCSWLLAALAVRPAAWCSRSKFGFALRAINQDEDAAASMGINTTRDEGARVRRSPASSPALVGAAYAFQQVTIFPRRGCSTSTSPCSWW